MVRSLQENQSAVRASFYYAYFSFRFFGGYSFGSDKIPSDRA